jgi:hypothetical protein
MKFTLMALKTITLMQKVFNCDGYSGELYVDVYHLRNYSIYLEI